MAQFSISLVAACSLIVVGMVAAQSAISDTSAKLRSLNVPLPLLQKQAEESVGDAVSFASAFPEAVLYNAASGQQGSSLHSLHALNKEAEDFARDVSRFTEMNMLTEENLSKAGNSGRKFLSSISELKSKGPSSEGLSMLTDLSEKTQVVVGDMEVMVDTLKRLKTFQGGVRDLGTSFNKVDMARLSSSLGESVSSGTGIVSAGSFLSLFALGEAFTPSNIREKIETSKPSTTSPDSGNLGNIESIKLENDATILDPTRPGGSLIEESLIGGDDVVGVGEVGDAGLIVETLPGTGASAIATVDNIVAGVKLISDIATVVGAQDTGFVGGRGSGVVGGGQSGGIANGLGNWGAVANGLGNLGGVGTGLGNVGDITDGLGSVGGIAGPLGQIEGVANGLGDVAGIGSSTGNSANGVNYVAKVIGGRSADKDVMGGSINANVIGDSSLGVELSPDLVVEGSKKGDSEVMMSVGGLLKRRNGSGGASVAKVFATN